MPDKVTQQPYNMFSLQKSTPMSTFAERHMPILQGGQKVDYAQQQLQQNIQNAMQQPQQVVEQPVQTPVAQRPQPVVNPNDPNSGMEALLYTSPEQEEKMRRASVQRQRIMAIGDALRHIGNVVNTVNYAPSQQFNSPAENERKRYLGEKAIRDANNYKYMSYQQAKAAQEQKMKQWETQFAYNLAKDARDYELKKNESEARQQRQKALAELDKARLEGQIDKNTYQRLVNQYYPEQAQARINEIESRIAKNDRTGGGGGRRSGGGSGRSGRDFETTITYDENQYDPISGKLIKKGAQHTKRTYTSGNGNKKKLPKSGSGQKKQLP